MKLNLKGRHPAKGWYTQPIWAKPNRVAITLASILSVGLSGCSQLSSLPPLSAEDIAKITADSVSRISVENKGLGQQDVELLMNSIIKRELKNRISAQSIFNSLRPICYHNGTSLADADKDGIYSTASSQIYCAWGDQPSKNWISYNGSYSIVDLDDHSSSSGFQESVPLLQFTYWDDGGNATTYKYTMSNKVYNYDSSTNKFTVEYSETLETRAASGSPPPTGLGFANIGWYYPNSISKPFISGRVDIDGQVNVTDATSRLKYVVSGENIKVYPGCVQGTVTVKSTETNTSQNIATCSN